MEILFLLLLGLAAACALIGVVSFGMALFFLREPPCRTENPHDAVGGLSKKWWPMSRTDFSRAKLPTNAQHQERNAQSTSREC